MVRNDKGLGGIIMWIIVCDENLLIMVWNECMCNVKLNSFYSNGLLIELMYWLLDLLWDIWFIFFSLLFCLYFIVLSLISVCGKLIINWLFFCLDWLCFFFF